MCIYSNIQLLAILFFPNFIDLAADSNELNRSSTQNEGKGPGNKNQDCSTSEKAMEDTQERQREGKRWSLGL